MGDIPGPTPGDGLGTGGDSATPVEDVEIEDGSSIAAAAWKTLEAEKDALGLPDLKVQSLPDFLKSAQLPKLTKDEKSAIVNQGLLQFQHFYSHMPFKAKLDNFSDPVERLKALASQLDSMNEYEFHSAVADAFGGVADSHTCYGLPAPYLGAVAFLPFQVRFFQKSPSDLSAGVAEVLNAAVPSAGQPGGLGHPFFGPGAEIVKWNNVDAAWKLLDEEIFFGPLVAGSEGVNITRKAIFSTTVSLAYLPPPDIGDPQVVVHYIPRGGGPLRGIFFPWGVAANMGGRSGFPHAAYSVNVTTAATTSANSVFVRQHGFLVAVAPSIDLQRLSRIPAAFAFQYTGGAAQPDGLDPAFLRADAKPGARFGYLRIRQFQASGPLSSTDELVGEFQRILQDVMNPMAPDGLVLDVRGNPGGDVQAAERMLQMLTTAHIEPIQFHLANTPAVQKVLETLQSETQNSAGLTPEQSVRLTDAQAQLQPWIDDVAISKANGGPLTTGHPLTKPEQANAIGQVYHGRCVLLIDGLTYSAADIFAAGFQDHGIGLILGVDQQTGGGGANVWSHGNLLDYLPPLPDLPLQPLPPVSADADETQRPTMSLAIRRCLRVGRNAGRAIEDTGVAADVYAPPNSAEDLPAGFPTLIRLGCKLLAESADLSLEIRKVTFGEKTVEVELQTAVVDWLELELDTADYLSGAVQPGAQRSF